MGDAFNKRFLILLSVENVPPIKRLSVTVVDNLTGANLERIQQPVGADDEAWLTAAEQIASNLGPRLYGLLDGARDRPIQPQLLLSAAPAEVPLGGSVVVTATLQDADGTRAPNKQIKVVHHSPITTDTLWVNTDGQGQYRTTFGAGGTPGLGRVEVSFQGRDQQLADPQAEGYRVLRPAISRSPLPKCNCAQESRPRYALGCAATTLPPPGPP